MPNGPTRREIVAPHIHDTTCYVLAQHEPCATIAQQQRRANRMRTTPKGKVGRDIRPLTFEDLPRLKPKRGWMLVVLVCRDDDLSTLIAWVQADTARADRTHLYHHAPTESGPLLKPWADAELPMPRIDSFVDQRDLSSRFGLDTVQRIMDDVGPSARRPPI